MNNNNFTSSHPISPKSIRLEKELNQKLPRIRPKPSTEVNSTLQKSMLTRNQNKDESNKHYIEKATTSSISLSINETTNLKPICKTNKLDPPNCSIVPLKINNKSNNTAFDFLIDNNIKCKFTVICSPMNNEQKNNNIIWEFDNETDLIKGLSGVHLSLTNSFWMDLISDRTQTLESI